MSTRTTRQSARLEHRVSLSRVQTAKLTDLDPVEDEEDIRDDEKAMNAKPPHAENRRAAFPCLRQSAVQNRDFQESVGRRGKTQKNMAIYWGMGFGKTHGGALSTRCALEQSRQEGIERLVVVLTQKNLIDNFKDGLRSYGLTDEYIARHYRFYGFEEASYGAKRPQVVKDCVNAIIAIDEVHEIRNSKSIQSRAILALVRSAWKLVVLTGTPLVNYISDL